MILPTLWDGDLGVNDLFSLVPLFEMEDSSGGSH